MSNVLVNVSYKLDLPESLLADIVGRPDDDSQRWYTDACNAAEDWAKDHPADHGDFMHDEPDYEAN